MQGHGCLLDSHHVQVGDDKLSAERILIATGARPWVPDIPGAEHAITSDEAFHLEELPRHIAIVGGGYIAVEFASIFNGLGAEVDLLYRGEQILRGFDRDVRDTLAAEMGHKGVNVRLNTSVSTVERNADGFRLKLEDGEECRVDQLMYATGRVPNVMDLGVDAAGIEMHPGGWIPVDEYSRTNVPNIFAVGDVTHRIELTPVATHEGQAFAESEFGGRDRTIDHEFVPSAVFSQPPVATVGFAEHEAAEHYGELEVYRSHFRPLKHTLTGRNEHTMMKLVVQAATGRVVGLHVVGMDAPEIVQGFAIAVKFGMTKDQFDATIGIHPTAAEELVTMRRKVELATAVQG